MQPMNIEHYIHLCRCRVFIAYCCNILWVNSWDLLKLPMKRLNQKYTAYAIQLMLQENTILFFLFIHFVLRVLQSVESIFKKRDCWIGNTACISNTLKYSQRKRGLSKTRSKQATSKCVYESKAWVYRLVYSMLSHQFENGRLKGITCVSEFASCLNNNFITFISFFLIAILYVCVCISKQFYLYKKYQRLLEQFSSSAWRETIFLYRVCLFSDSQGSIIASQ